jgi:hypothetical protein
MPEPESKTMLPDASGPILNQYDLSWEDYGWDSDVNRAYLPDFFLISPGLSGRIFVTSVIRKHPDIQIQAPDYFSMEWSQQDISWYGHHFRESRHRIKVDASDSHVFLPAFAIKKIKALKPDLRIIFILQDPRVFCREYVNHQFFYSKGVFSGRDLYLEHVPESLILECLIGDDLLSRVDYESILKRWTKYFPSSQIFIGFLEHAADSPDRFFSHLFNFLKAANPEAIQNFPSCHHNPGHHLDDKTDFVTNCVESVHHPRKVSFNRYLEDLSLPLPPWEDNDVQGGLSPVYLEKRKKNWRIYLKEGMFQAVQEKTGQSLKSAFLSDMRRAISLNHTSLSSGTDPDEVSNCEDSRLCSVLSEQAKQRTLGKQKTDRLNQISFIEDYHLYNILRSGGRFIAIQQSMGPVTLFREKLGEREISPHILRAETLEAVKRKVDHARDAKESLSGINGIVERWL